MQRQRLADGVAVARQDVEHAGRNAGVDRQLGNADGGQRRLLGGLEHHRVAGGQRRAELPAGHHQREIPRHDGRHHADRLAGDQAQLVMGRGRYLVVDLVDRLAAPAQRPRGARDVHRQRVADRFAHVEGFQQGQLLAVGFQQVGEADHHCLALGRRQARPAAGLECGTGAGHRALGIDLVAAGDLRQHPPVHRADAVELAAVRRGAILTLDKGATFDVQVAGTLLPIGEGQGGHGASSLVRSLGCGKGTLNQRC